jgi:hypothetical protein
MAGVIRLGPSDRGARRQDEQRQDGFPHLMDLPPSFGLLVTPAVSGGSDSEDEGRRRERAGTTRWDFAGEGQRRLGRQRDGGRGHGRAGAEDDAAAHVGGRHVLAAARAGRHEAWAFIAAAMRGGGRGGGRPAQAQGRRAEPGRGQRHGHERPQESPRHQRVPRTPSAA